MTEHDIERCDRPRPRRKYLNRPWICSVCGRAWLARWVASYPDSSWVWYEWTPR